MLRHKLILLLLCLAAISFRASADNAVNSKEQILIHADSMTLNINTGSSVYQGNVSFTQGKIEIHGDTVTVLTKNGSITEVKVTGTPARYTDSSQNRHILAESNNMDYRVADNKLSLHGKAKLEQKGRLVQSENILYDTRKQVILAGKSSGSNSSPDQRVNIILTPKKKQTP